MAKKNVLGDRSPPPPPSKVWMTGPPLSQGLDPALSDTKYHKILQTLIIFEHIYNAMIFHKCFVIVPRD